PADDSSWRRPRATDDLEGPCPAPRVGGRGSGTDEAGDGRGGLLHLRVRFGTARVDGFGDAVADVVLQQSERDRLEGTGRRGDLGEDVDAVGVVLDHPLQAPDLPFDPPEPGKIRLLVTGIAMHG